MSKRCLGCMETYDDNFNVCPHCGYVNDNKTEEAIHMTPGSKLHNRYIIGRVLGYGGFGVTYIGWDEKLEQKVAIKEYLPGEFSTRMPGQTKVSVFNGEKSEQFRDGMKKFVDEAKRLAKFQNEAGIVKIFDSFEENETAYIIMEYLDGITLKQYLEENGVMDEDTAVNLLMPVMRSLQVVHAEGILHRDIAPDNIFLTKDGEIKLIDFGASRYATTSHSRSLTVIIKPGFSPEEQYRSRGDQGAYTDVYALSATLYKMITGKTPPDAMERRAKYENQNKDILIEPHKIVKGISRNREVAILNAMNVRIEDRTPDIETFIQELYADPPAKRRSGKIKKIDIYSWPLWLKILVPSAAALLITFGILVLTGVIDFRSMFNAEIDGFVSVPKIVGENIDSAESMSEFKKEELRLKKGVKKLDSGEELDIIITQNPLENELVPIGSAVFYNYSGGNEEDYKLEESADGTSLKFKNTFDGLSKDQLIEGRTIEEYLTEEGYNVRTKEEYSAEYPTAGTIIRIETDNGTVIKSGTEVAKNATIVIVYSKGEAPIDVPNVVGMKLDEARNALLAVGFSNINVEPKQTDSVEENTVLEQNPTSGTKIAPAEAIVLQYATPEPTAAIADVSGFTEAEAKDALKLFDVYVQGIYDSQIAEGKVIKTVPEAGQQNVKGEKVVVYISKGPQPVKVSFDYDGADNNNGSGSETKYLGKEYGELPTPTKDGYVFSGWYLSKSWTAYVSKSTLVEKSEDHTLYARWTAGKYTVTFDSTVDRIAVDYNSTYSDLPRPQKTGYDFVNWHLGSVTGDVIKNGSHVETSSDHKLYAEWRAKEYTVTLVANGGTFSNSATTASKTVTYDSTYGSLTQPTFAGKVFVKWHLESINGSEIKSTDKVKTASNHRLVAEWKNAKYTVTLVANGGKNIPSSISVEYLGYYNDLPDSPSKNYCTFAGWYDSQDHKYTSSTRVAITSNQTLYARWKGNPTSDWIEAGKMPSGAKIVDTKWTYTLRETKTSSSSSLSGWTQIGKQKNGYNENVIGPVYSDPSNSERKVTSESYISGYNKKTEYNYTRYTNSNYNHFGPTKAYWGNVYCGIYQERGWGGKLSVFGSENSNQAGFFYKYNKSNDPWYNEVTREVNDSPIYSTRWYYQEPKYSYTYERYTHNHEATSDPTGNSNVSNVKKYVRYIAK